MSELNKLKLNPANNLQFRARVRDYDDDEETPKKESLPSTPQEIRDEFVKAKKENGWIRKIYDWMKNKTGTGLGSKKIEKDIDKFERGELTKEQINKEIKDYRISQYNAAQSAGDIVATGTSLGSFFLAKNFIKKYATELKLGVNKEKNPISKMMSEITDGFMGGTLKRAADNNKKLALLLAIPIGFNSLFFKDLFMRIERMGSKEFEVDKNIKDKRTRKREKDFLKQEKRSENRSNMLTGFLAGIFAPVAMIAGGFVGIPLYFAGMTGLRYLKNKHNDKEDRSFQDFAKQFKDNAAMNTISTGLVALPAFKHARYSAVLSKNIDEVFKNLNGKNLKLPELPSTKSALQQLEEIMVHSEKIDKIINSWSMSMDDKIRALTEENILAVKMLQINEELGGSLSKALQENCPRTYDNVEAISYIESHLGKGLYNFDKMKCLGVGTIAETYLAKDIKTGKNVCIKILKKGITAEKIKADGQKFIQMITNGLPESKWSEEQKYLVRNIEDLTNGILKEVDFIHEAQAAKDLAPFTHTANVVKPIVAKEGVYVMETANGISLKKLAEYFDVKCRIGMEKNPLFGGKSNPEKIAELEKEMKKIKDSCPDFEDFDLSTDDLKLLMDEYIKIYTEQFTKLYKDGKVLHADIHPGNMFVNLDALKSGKGKLFTLIDTGNTIRLTKEQTQNSIKLIAHIKNGNYKELTKIILSDAKLPQGMTLEQATEKIEADLKKYFFDYETKIDIMTLDNFYTLTENIFRKYGIIGNDTQLNLNKAKTSCMESYNKLVESFMNERGSKMDDLFSTIAEGLGGFKDMRSAKNAFNKAQSKQELLNMRNMSFQNAKDFLLNPNKNATNSKEYLTYQFKQGMQNGDEEGNKRRFF